MSEKAITVGLTATSSAGTSTTTGLGFPALMVRVVNDSTQAVWINVGSSTVTASTSAGFPLIAVSATQPHDDLTVYAHSENRNLPKGVAAYILQCATAAASTGTIRIYATDV